MYDDGGGLPDVARGEQRRGSGDGSDRYSADEGFDDRRRGVPNFLVRRAIVVGLVVVLIAVAAIAAGNLLGGSDSDSRSAFGDSDWNTVVAIDQNIGTVCSPTPKVKSPAGSGSVSNRSPILPSLARL